MMLRILAYLYFLIKSEQIVKYFYTDTYRFAMVERLENVSIIPNV